MVCLEIKHLNLFLIHIIRKDIDLMQEMMVNEENIGNVILQCRAFSTSAEWTVVTPWQWKPIPRDTHFVPHITLAEFPIPLKADQHKAMLKVYSSLIRPEDWLPILT